MKNDLLEIIVEAYNNDEISTEDAVAYSEFVECADLENVSDVEVLTEMVDSLLPSDCDDYYIEKSCGGSKSKPNNKEKKQSKFKAKLANAKAKISANKGKIAAGAAIGLGGAALGYAGAKSKSNKVISNLENRTADLMTRNSELVNRNSALKDAFKSANKAKRNEIKSSRNLLNQRNGLQKEVQSKDDAFRDMAVRYADQISNNAKLRRHLDTALKDSDELRTIRRAEVYRKARENGYNGVKDSINNRAHVDLSVKQEQLDELNRKLNASTRKRKKRK